MAVSKREGCQAGRGHVCVGVGRIHTLVVAKSSGLTWPSPCLLKSENCSILCACLLWTSQIKPLFCSKPSDGFSLPRVQHETLGLAFKDLDIGSHPILSFSSMRCTLISTTAAFPKTLTSVPWLPRRCLPVEPPSSVHRYWITIFLQNPPPPGSPPSPLFPNSQRSMPRTTLGPWATLGSSLGTAHVILSSSTTY